VPALVLVVEDNREIVSVVREALEDEGYAVMTVGDGQAALQALDSLESTPPALIILDYQMPVMDGAAFAAAYRKRPPPHAPILLLTAASSARDRAALVRADGFVSKPFLVDSLLEAVARLVQPG
jgi:CheY-like chemotaxis protein